jgi:hypothetical protein
LVTFLFVLSLVTRTRNLEKDIEVLKTLMEEEQKERSENHNRQPAEEPTTYRPLAPDRR